MSETSAAPGWELIDAAVRGLPEGLEGRHYGTVVPYQLGGPGALQGVRVVRRSLPRPHLLLVTFGLTELSEKELARPEVSGFGFELVLRVPAPAQGEEPPAWALSLLEQLAEYVGQTGNLFAPGHTFALGGPLTPEPSCRLTGLLFVADPELQGRQGPFGRVDFLEVVGISEAERAAAKAWSSAGLQALLAERDALLVTDPSRPSLLDEPAVARRVEEAAAREGSTMGALLVPGLRWTGEAGAAVLELEAGSVEDVRRLVQGRLPHGRTLMLSAPDGGPAQMALLAPAARAAVHAGGEGPLRVELSPALTGALVRTLKAAPGLYRLEGLPGLTVKVR